MELVKKLTGSLYWWVEQCVPTRHRECPHSDKSQETKVFGGHQKLTSAMKLWPEK